MTGQCICRVCGRLHDKEMTVGVEEGSSPLCVLCAGGQGDRCESLRRASYHLGTLSDAGIARAIEIARTAQLRRDARRHDLNLKQGATADV